MLKFNSFFWTIEFFFPGWGYFFLLQTLNKTQSIILLSFYSSVPYVNVSLVFNDKTVETRQTKKKRSQNPVWNQGFLFDVDVNQIELYSFVFQVMDYDLLLSDQLVGEVTVGSNQPDESSGKKHWDEMMRKANENKKRETAMCHAI